MFTMEESSGTYTNIVDILRIADQANQVTCGQTSEMCQTKRTDSVESMSFGLEEPFSARCRVSSSLCSLLHSRF